MTGNPAILWISFRGRWSQRKHVPWWLISQLLWWSAVTECKRRSASTVYLPPDRLFLNTRVVLLEVPGHSGCICFCAWVNLSADQHGSKNLTSKLRACWKMFVSNVFKMIWQAVPGRVCGRALLEPQQRGKEKNKSEWRAFVGTVSNFDQRKYESNLTNICNKLSKTA